MDYILSKQLKPCMVCGKLTNQIEVCSEGYLCSDECNKKWYQDYKNGSREPLALAMGMKV